MNKIYNNLTIDNLMKTNWFNQFKEYQKEEIRRGLEDDLVVSEVAKGCFERKQAEQRRLKLLREKQRKDATSKILHDIYFLLNISIIALDLL